MYINYIYICVCVCVCVCVCEKSVGTTELHYSMKKRYHVLDILKSLFSSDAHQSIKRRIATER